MSIRIPSIIILSAGMAGAQVYTPLAVNSGASFTNTNPAITALLTDPVNGLGIQKFTLHAVTEPAPPGGARYAEQSMDLWPLAAPAVGINFRVDNTVGGLSYRMSPVITSPAGHRHWFPQQVHSTTTTLWPNQQNAAVVDLRFVDSLGFLQAVDGGVVYRYDTSVDPPRLTGEAPVKEGAKNVKMLAASGGAQRFDLFLGLGGGDYTSTRYRIRRSWTPGSPLAADAITTQNIIVNGEPLGGVKGHFDVMNTPFTGTEAVTTPDGLFEVTLPTPLQPALPDYPLLRVMFSDGNDGRANWSRELSFTGTNFTTEATGSFAGENLPVPSLPSERYLAWAETWMRRSSGALHTVQYLRSPILGHGSNAAPVITEGSDLNLGNTFVMQAGYLTGAVVLEGPPAVPGQPPMLQHLRRYSDDDANSDGVPESDPAGWHAHTNIWASGTDDLAGGGSYTASGGLAFVMPEGNYNAGTGWWTGTYSLAVAGLDSDTTRWQQDVMSWHFENPGTSAATYFDTAYVARRLTPVAQTITPGGYVASSVQQAFGEVCLTLRAASGNIFKPTVRRITADPASGLAFDPDNFRASGWPRASFDATPTAYLRMLLPAGTHTFYPQVSDALSHAGGGFAELAPITVSVPPRGRVCMEPDFRILASIPDCLAGPDAVLSGTILSGSTSVASITYTLDGGAPVTVSGSGVNPAFSIPFGTLAEGSHTITITVTGTDGRTATLSGSFVRFAEGLTIEPAVILRWPCGVLQSSTDLLSWADVPGAVSPHCEPTAGPRKYWRIRP